MMIYGHDICNIFVSLNQFDACPREKYLDLTVRSFGYLKQVQDPQNYIDCKSMQFNRTKPEFYNLVPDFLEDYLHTKDKVDPPLPQSFGLMLNTTILVNSDHTHNRKTRRSLTGLFVFVGSTPILW